jgi:DNA-binding Xre family transcriptional regulator
MIIVRLKEVAESQGYNLSRLQKASGVDLGVLRRLWKWDGTLQSIHVSSLDRLCAILKVQPGDIIRFTTTPSGRGGAAG